MTFFLAFIFKKNIVYLVLFSEVIKINKKKLTNLVAFSVLMTAISFPGSAFGQTTTVKPGDTLYRISINNNVSVDYIKELNGLKDNIIYPGQTLLLKKVTPETPEKPSTNKPDSSNKEESITHTVVTGDTLWAISNKYKTTVNSIKELNKLSSNIIHIGQKLKITNGTVSEKPDTSKPTTPVEVEKPNDNVTTTNDVVHTVTKGETLWGVSTKYNKSVNQIKEWNNLSSNIIYVGQQIKIKNFVVEPILNWPAEGIITSEVGERWGRYHYGIDIAKNGDVKILSAADGIVTHSQTMNGFGEIIAISHEINGKKYATVYAHMKKDSRSVSVGDRVSSGQFLGWMGATGDATGQHLHFELHKDKWEHSNINVLNPLDFLKSK